MDALAALWFTSVVGAAGFSATGFFLARSMMPAGDARVAGTEPAEREPVLVPDVASPPPAPEPVAVVTAKASPSLTPKRDLRREEEEDAARAVDNVIDVVGIAPKKEARSTSARPPVVAPSGLDRQLQALRGELRAEVTLRGKAEAHARDLAVRLSSVSEQMAALRARASEDHGAARRSSIIPSAAADARTRLSSRAPGLFAEIDELRGEVSRLTAENESLRAGALGAPALSRRPPARRTDLIVPEVLKRMVDQIARLGNVRAAAVADASGLVLAGAGELSDALAAFGAYMQDAATRSQRLLPLKSTEEVTERDSYGLVFSTQMLGRPESELSLITLALGTESNGTIREIVSRTPGVEVDPLRAR